MSLPLLDHYHLDMSDNTAFPALQYKTVQILANIILSCSKDVEEVFNKLLIRSHFPILAMTKLRVIAPPVSFPNVSLQKFCFPLYSLPPFFFGQFLKKGM